MKTLLLSLFCIPLSFISFSQCDDGLPVLYVPGGEPAENSFTITDCQGNVLAEMSSGLNGYYNDCLSLGDNYQINLFSNSFYGGWSDAGLIMGDQVYTMNQGLYDISILIGDCSIPGYIDFFTFGCTDEIACNYNETAVIDDDSCIYSETCYTCNGDCSPGCILIGGECVPEILCCTDPEACNYEPYANVDNGSCIYPETCYNCSGDCETGCVLINGECIPEILGCTDELACNYNETANIDDDSCTYSETCYTCSGDCAPGCILISGECVPEILCCTDPEACNYEPYANVDNGSCIYPETCYTCSGDCETGCVLINGECIPEILGCTDQLACNYNETANIDDESCMYVDGICDSCENGIVIDNDSNDDGVCDGDLGCFWEDEFYEIGSLLFVDDCTLWQCNLCELCPSCPIVNDCLEWISITNNNCVGCTDPDACNYNDIVIIDDNSCIYPETCYDCDGNCSSDCILMASGCIPGIFGCTDLDACNYDPDANIDDDSCWYAELYYTCGGTCSPGCISIGGECVPEIWGCTDPEACNYDPDSNIDDDSCWYAELYYTCGGTCSPGCILIGGECVPEILGCTSSEACNYDPYANEDDDSCIYPASECNSVLTFQNSSFENNVPFIDIADGTSLTGDPGCFTAPYPWEDCMPVLNGAGSTIPLTPGSQPGCYNIQLPASDGNNYIGFGHDISVDNETYTGADIDEWQEGISQELSSNMIAGVEYSFSVDLVNIWTGDAWNNYINLLPTIGELRVYAGFEDCSEQELLWSSGLVDNEAWETYTVLFTPSNNYTHVLFQVYNSGQLGYTSYMGLDNISNVTPTSEIESVLDANCECVPVSTELCEDESACNYEYIYQPFGCEYVGDNCSELVFDPIAGTIISNYNSSSSYVWSDDCECLAIEGCTDSTACNYNTDAIDDDGSCTYLTFGLDIDMSEDICYGDSTGVITVSIINYESVNMDIHCNLYMYNNTIDYQNYQSLGENFDFIFSGLSIGSYTVFCYDMNDDIQLCSQTIEVSISQGESCECECDTDEDGVCNIYDFDCDGDGIPNYEDFDNSSCLCGGCTDEIACNYDPDASMDDGSCDYLFCAGCTDTCACNYNVLAEISNNELCDYTCYADTIYIDNYIYETDTVYVDNYIYQTDTVYLDFIITEYVDCDTGLPCGSTGALELINKSMADGKIYNLLGQEIHRREGIYIENGEIKHKIQ